MDVEKFLGKADLALRKRNAPQAIALYKQVLVASPGHPGARSGLLAAYRRKAELKGGPSMLDKAAARSLRAATAGLKGARQAETLVKTCDTGLEKDPHDPVLAATLAAALEGLGRTEEALATWSYRLELDEGDVAALKAAGMLHYRLKQLEQAVSCLDRAHAIDAHDPEVEKLRKNLAAEGTLAATRFETARSSRELIKDRDALVRAEQVQRLHKTTDELSVDIEGLEQQLAGAPGDVDLRRRLARAQMRAGRLEAALETVDAGLTERSEDDTLLDLRGDLQLALVEAELTRAREGGDSQALKQAKERKAVLETEELGRRVRRQPGDTALRLRLGRACYRAGQTEAAIEHFQAVAADPRVELEARQGLGACFFRKGLLPLARRQFEQALDRAGGVGGGDRGKEICYSLALVCERLGDAPGALQRYMEVYEVDIHYKDVAAKVDGLGSA